MVVFTLQANYPCQDYLDLEYSTVRKLVRHPWFCHSLEVHLDCLDLSLGERRNDLYHMRKRGPRSIKHC